MKWIFIICIFLMVSGMMTAQTTENKASKKDSILLAKFKAKGTYPLIKASKLSGVMPVEGINEKADVGMKYKLLFSLATGTNDPQKVKDQNKGLAEIGRIINLHIAAGVPRENIEVVIVSHRKSLYSLFSNDAFKKEFKIDNPNITLIQELESAGSKFIACGQAMQFLDIDRASLLPSVKIAIASKVALSTYQSKGFVLYEIDED